MNVETEALLDAATGRWYGLIKMQSEGRTPRVVRKTDPVYHSNDECLADLDRIRQAIEEGRG